ncbi:uncharacterized protein LOC134239565 [Saccostrea cucullata]|uniref:uncharacterized protein LOC134239565 n=1 Tax=Saccostrea cuccullata TaxID=36930 RepID=UPI002ED4660E
MGAKRGSHLNSAQSIHLRSSDPSELSSLRKPTMNTSRKPNPILSAPGVSRNPAINTEASRSQQRRNEDVATNRNPLGVASENSGRILGVQEHRIIHSDPIEYTKFDTSTLVTSSGWRNKSQAAQGGVGLLLDRKARKSLLKVVPSKSGRILVAEFDGNPQDSVIEEFYTELRNVLQDVPAHNFLAVMGDFNARLGPEHVPHPFHELTNRSGNYLAEILVEFGLLAVNTQFKKRPGKLWTFKCRASNTLKQLDYILVRQKWRNSVHNAEAYNSFSTVKSDHRIVSAKIKLSLRTSKTAQKVKYDWKQFSSNTELQKKYTVAVKNRFQILMDESNSERYEKFVKANQEAMKECLPKRAKIKKSLRSLDPRVSEARQKAQEAQRQYESSKTDEDKDLWSVAVNNLYQAYKLAQEEELAEQIQGIETAHGEQRYGEAWKVVNEITGRKKAKEGQVAGNSPEERVSTWYTHFKNLLGNQPDVDEPEEEIPKVFDDIDINDEPFTLAEYRKVKSSLKLGKAAGPDEIPPEVFKLCDFDSVCLGFCNDALANNDKPDTWSFMNIVTVPKSGDLSKTDNYRGISLICIIVKIYNRLILNRIRSVIDLRLRTNQNCFRPGRTTVAQILSLRRIIECVKANNLKAVFTFIDFRKAFDSIHRGKMIRILKAYGIPPNLLRAIEKMYTNTMAKIVTPDGETSMFEITAGVLQGDTLAPFLFIIVLDYALRKAISGNEEELGFTILPRKSRRHPKQVLTDLDFADDISLLSDEIVQAQELLSRVERECCGSWTLTVAQEKSLDGTYTRMLRKVLDIHWSSQIPNEFLYGNLPKVSDKIASRRLQLAGHCFRHPELSAQSLVLWEPNHGRRRRGRPKATF